ncbi:MAG: hypothetical protein AB7E85_03375 [Pseudobdellovibrionaceae bacterium]
MSSGQNIDANVAETIAKLKDKLRVFYFIGDTIGRSAEMRLFESTSQAHPKPDGISKRWCADFNKAVRNFETEPTRLKAARVFLLVSDRLSPFIEGVTSQGTHVLQPTMQLNGIRSEAQSCVTRRKSLPVGGPPSAESWDIDTINARLRECHNKYMREDISHVLSLANYGLLTLGFASAANDLGEEKVIMKKKEEVEEPLLLSEEDITPPKQDGTTPSVA